ncbi:MAG: ATP-binding protein [bacterium]|nr:ATP-binding protein [bacterium]
MPPNISPLKGKISIKHLLLVVMVIPLMIINAIVAAGFFYVLYQTIYSQILNEKIALLQNLNFSLNNPNDTIHEQELVQNAAKSPHVVFIRVVDLYTKEITLATDQTNKNMELKIPSFADNLSHFESVINNTSLSEVTVKGSGNKGLWLGFETDTIQLKFAELAGFLFLLLIIVNSAIYFLIQLFFEKFFLKPLDETIVFMDKLSKGDFQAKNLKSHKMIREIERLDNTSDKIVTEFNENKKRYDFISKMKSEFISIAAHQLRTPLSAIKWMIEMLKDGDVGPLTEEQKSFLQKGNDTNNRMINLVNDLLKAEKIDAGIFGYNFEFSNLVDVIEKSINENIQLAQQRKVGVEFTKGIKNLPLLKIDKDKLKIAIDNIIGNAIRYNKEGKKVEISIQPNTNKYIEVIIKDHGIGIPKNQVDKIFSKFFRGVNATKVHTDGSGLGLYITKNIIINHGGTVWIESKENIGTSFHFTLPTQASLIPKTELKFDDFIQSL